MLVRDSGGEISVIPIQADCTFELIANALAVTNFTCAEFVADDTSSEGILAQVNVDLGLVRAGGHAVFMTGLAFMTKE